MRVPLPFPISAFYLSLIRCRCFRFGSLLLVLVLFPHCACISSSPHPGFGSSTHITFHLHHHTSSHCKLHLHISVLHRIACFSVLGIPYLPGILLSCILVPSFPYRHRSTGDSLRSIHLYLSRFGSRHLALTEVRPQGFSLHYLVSLLCCSLPMRYQ